MPQPTRRAVGGAGGVRSRASTTCGGGEHSDITSRVITNTKPINRAQPQHKPRDHRASGTAHRQSLSRIGYGCKHVIEANENNHPSCGGDPANILQTRNKQIVLNVSELRRPISMVTCLAWQLHCWCHTIGQKTRGQTNCRNCTSARNI
jgi:hypothetical protein